MFLRKIKITKPDSAAMTFRPEPTDCQRVRDEVFDTCRHFVDENFSTETLGRTFRCSDVDLQKVTISASGNLRISVEIEYEFDGSLDDFFNKFNLESFVEDLYDDPAVAATKRSEHI